MTLLYSHFIPDLEALDTGHEVFTVVTGRPGRHDVLRVSVFPGVSPEGDRVMSNLLSTELNVERDRESKTLCSPVLSH